jgi:hypothetical protein
LGMARGVRRRYLRHQARCPLARQCRWRAGVMADGDTEFHSRERDRRACWPAGTTRQTSLPMTAIRGTRRVASRRGAHTTGGTSVRRAPATPAAQPVALASKQTSFVAFRAGGLCRSPWRSVHRRDSGCLNHKPVLQLQLPVAPGSLSNAGDLARDCQRSGRL